MEAEKLWMGRLFSYGFIGNLWLNHKENRFFSDLVQSFIFQRSFHFKKLVNQKAKAIKCPMLTDQCVHWQYLPLVPV